MKMDMEKLKRACADAHEKKSSRKRLGEIFFPIIRKKFIVPLGIITSAEDVTNDFSLAFSAFLSGKVEKTWPKFIAIMERFIKLEE